MKTQLALALLLALSTVSVQAQHASGKAKEEPPPAQKSQKVAYARCCVPPGGDGTSEKPYSSFKEADADKSWNKLSVMPTQGDLDKMGSDTLQSQTDKEGSVNLNRAPTFTPPPRSTQTTLSGRVIETIGTSNIFDCKCAPPGAPGN